MSDQTDNTQPDPWAIVPRWHTDGDFCDSAYWDDIDHARAQVAAQHTAEIADYERQIDCMGIEMENADVELATLRAERDAAMQENARMDEAAENLTKDLWQLQQEIARLRAERDASKHEAQSLREALAAQGLLFANELDKAIRYNASSAD